MHEGLKTFGEYGLKVAAVTALGRTPASVYGKAGAAMTTWAAAEQLGRRTGSDNILLRGKIT